MAPRPADNRKRMRLAGAPPNRTGIDDAGLLERARSGDDSAFEDLVRRHHETVWRLVWRLIREGAHVEALVQQVFVDLRLELSEVQRIDQFRACLCRIAVERVARFVKPRGAQRPGTRRSAELAVVVEESDANREELRLESCLQSLVGTLRAPLCLQLEGLSYDEIANTLGLSVDAVRTRLFLARDALVKCMDRNKVQSDV